KGADGVRNFFNAVRGKVIGNVAKPGWDNNVLAAIGSNSQNTVGWFGSEGTAMSDWAWKAGNKGSKDIIKSLYDHIGKTYPGFPQNAKTVGWKSEVGGKDLFNSQYAFNKANAEKGTKLFYTGFAKGG